MAARLQHQGGERDEFHCSILALFAGLLGWGGALPTVDVSRPEMPSSLVVIQNVSVLDVVSLEVTPAKDVVSRDGKIITIGAAGQLPATTGAPVIPGEGATLVPGLIDMHGHVNTATGPSWRPALPDPEANLRAYDVRLRRSDHGL